VLCDPWLLLSNVAELCMSVLAMVCPPLPRAHVASCLYSLPPSIRFRVFLFCDEILESDEEYGSSFFSQRACSIKT
jgi:hypothetical protein